MKKTSKFLKDESYPLICLIGDGARRFLQGQTTADVNLFLENQIFKSCLLSPTGKLNALLEIRILSQRVEVIVLAGNEIQVRDSFEKVIFPADKLRIEILESIRRIELIEFTQEKEPQYRIEWLSGNEKLYEKFRDYKIAESFDKESLRIELGIPSFPEEINGETNPFELGLSKHISLSKGCYLGQETLSKIANQGLVKQELRIWRSSSFLVRGEKLYTKAINEKDSYRAGLISSSMDQYNGVGSFGLALIRRQALGEKVLFSEDGSKSVSLYKPPGFLTFPIT